MTKDEFVLIFEENKELPFIIETSTGWSAPLKFIRALSDSVQVTSNGVPSFYRFSEIKSLSYDITKDTKHDLKEADPTTNPPTVSDDRSRYWDAEYTAAKERLNYRIELTDRIQTLRTVLKDTSLYKDWNRIMDMFNYAQKIHSIDQRSDQILSQLDLLPDCKEVRVTYGLIYEALKEYDTAAEEFYRGSDYYNAACCAKLYGDDELVLKNLVCLVKNGQINNNDALASLFYLLTKFKRGAVCVNAFSDVDVSALPDASVEVIYSGLLSLLRCYDPQLASIKQTTGDRLEMITIFLREITNFSSDEPLMEIELSTLPKQNDLKAVPSPKDVNAMTGVNHDFIYEGYIYNFVVTENNAYGFISSSTEKNLYFNIRQVEDQELRDMLWNGVLQKATVSFTIGIGENGNKSADHLKLKESISNLHEIKEGMITSYGNYDSSGNRYGIIQCNGKDYLFWDNAVIDPVLQAYFSNSFSIKNVYVKFIGKKDKKNRIVLKVWFDATEEQKLIEEYKSYAEKRAYDVFLQNVYDLEHGSMASCPFSYELLPMWEEATPVVSEVKPVYHPPVEPYRKSEYKPVYPSKPTTYSLSRFGISELLQKGTYYLTKAKDLKKAEECFMEVLSRNPERGSINTAVSNLVTIYKRDDRFEDARNILEQYQRYLDHDKYHNHLVDILDKTKQYGQMIELLKEMIPNAGKAKPHRIKQLISCYIKTQNVKGALQALKTYRQHIDSLSYNTLYIHALDIQGDFAESERFLTNLISKTYRIEHKLNYISRLAVLYLKNNKAELAINMYEQWKKTFSSNRSSISTSATLASITKLEITVDQNLCVLYYQSGRKDEARQIAQNLIRKNSEDNIARQILDGTYVSENETITMLPEEENEYTLYEDADNTIPKLLERMLNEVEFENVFYKKTILDNYDSEKRRYIGDENQANEDIMEALNDISRPQSNYPLSAQSKIYMALAKIGKQFVDSGQKNKYITQKLLNALLGKSLMLRADSEVKKRDQNRDSSRYYYFLALRYLSRCGDRYRKDFNHALNLLYYSFFQSDNELANKVESPDMEMLHITPPDYEDSVFNPKELMVCTFDLQLNYQKSRIGEEIIRPMIDAIYTHSRLRPAFFECMDMITPESQEVCQNSDIFFGAWRRSKDQYSKQLHDLKHFLENAPMNIKEPEKLKGINNSIHELNPERLLCKTDMMYLERMREIIKKFVQFNEFNSVDDSVDTLDRVIDLCDTLEKQIRDTPTDFSYETLLDIIIELKGRALALKNELYIESIPQLEVYPDTNAYYKGDQMQAKITIYIENKGNVQRADISNIRLAGVDNHVEITGNPEHPVTTVHGNGKEEYCIDISFTEAEKQRGLFDIRFSFEYSYYVELGEMIKKSFSEVFQINLSSMDSFKKIENKYSSFTESGAVTANDMFFGREKEIQYIVDSLNMGDGRVLSHRGIYMYGQKRAGKSSIMAHVKERISSAFPERYLIIDLGSIGANSSNDGWLKANLIDKLGDEIEDLYPDIFHKIEESISFSVTYQNITQNPNTPEFDMILNKIGKYLPNTVIMIFVDEFTYIYESIKQKKCDDSFPHFWKALLQNYNICSIVIGQDSMKQFVEEYPNDFACMKEMPVSYLDEQSAKELITEPMCDNGKSRFEPDAVDLIYRLTAGSAYLIMIFCSALVDYMNERGTARVTRITVDTFLNKWLFDSAKNNNPITDFHFDAQLNDPCYFENEKQITRDNKTLLTYIARHCNQNNQIRIKDIHCTDDLSEKSAAYQKELIEQLIKRKVLVQDGEYCYILVDMLRIYLKRGNGSL